MMSDNKSPLKKIILYLFLFLIAGVSIFLLLPSNYYIRRALVHYKPKIDQYTIFQNRVVKADDPHPWEFAPDVEDKEIAPEFVDEFKSYKTVAFIVIQH